MLHLKNPLSDLSQRHYVRVHVSAQVIFRDYAVILNYLLQCSLIKKQTVDIIPKVKVYERKKIELGNTVFSRCCGIFG